MTLSTINKALVQLGAAAVAILILAGVDASREIEIIVGALLTLTPLVTYVVGNEGQIDLPFANKAIASLGAAVYGICLAFGVDVSTQVEQVSAAALALSPLLIGFVSNE